MSYWQLLPIRGIGRIEIEKIVEKGSINLPNILVKGFGLFVVYLVDECIITASPAFNEVLS